MSAFQEVLTYSFYIFQQNFFDFERVVNDYIEDLYGQGIKAFEVSRRQEQAKKFEEVRKETARHLHNYLSAWYSLKQQTYAAEKSLNEESLSSDIQTQKGEMFKDNPENTFIQDLRNYIQHRSLPLVDHNSAITFDASQPDFDINHDLFLEKDELLNYSKWTDPARSFLNKQPDQVPIKEIIKSNFQCIESFYLWLDKRINS